MPDTLPFSPPTRDDIQAEMVDALVRDRNAGIRSAILSAATGFGKTIVAGKVIRRGIDDWGGRFLFIVDEDNLVGQTVDKFQRWGLRVGVEHGQRKASEAMALMGGVDVVVATRQTLHAKRLLRWAPGRFTDIIVDEVHVGIKGKQIQTILSHFDPPFTVGLTATAFFADGTSLVPKYFDTTAYDYPLKDYADGRPGALSNGHLVPPRWVERDAGVDLKGLNTVMTKDGKDFKVGDLEQRITPKVEAIVNLAREEMGRLGITRAMSFSASVALASAFAAAFNRIGIAARAVYGDLPDKADVLADYHEGRIQVLCVCQMCLKAFDDPPTDGLIMTRPTQSQSLAWQMLGRGLRLSPETGKTCCNVVGFAWGGGKKPPVSTLDLFTADLPESTRAVARNLARTSRKPVDLMALIAQAKEVDRKDRQKAEKRAEARRKAAAGLQLQSLRKRDIHCDRRELDLLGVRAGTLQDYGAGPLFPGAATFEQAMALRELGFDQPGTMDAERAAREIRDWTDRIEAGMATYKQCKYLKVLGMPMSESASLDWRQARAAIDRLKSRRVGG